MPRMLCLAGAFLFSLSLLWSQTDTAALSGRVLDPSGAVLVAADVTVTNTDTGTSNQTKTNEAGVYSFSALRPGSYSLAVTARGFQRARREGLVLHTQD